MFEGQLFDLDELVLSVRNRNTRDYIGEATVNLRVHAYRSAICATWVAVTYDIISKIRELSMQGDPQAKSFIDRVDIAIGLRNSNPVESRKQLGAIESALLDTAKDDFEFLSDHEFNDMIRLRTDRHLCAHPAFASDDALFQPTPELVRTHIVHSVLALLQHPPIQGKAALARLKNDLLQPSFPSTQNAVSDFLDARYLKHIKTALVDNLITVLSKIIIKRAEPDLIGREEAVLKCLVAISRRYPQRFVDRMRNDLPRIVDAVSDDDLRRLMRLFRADRQCWSWLGTAVQTRLVEVVRKYDFDKNDIDAVAGCLYVDELRPSFAARAEQFSKTDKAILYSRYAHAAFVDDAVKQYTQARSFGAAEKMYGEFISPFASVLQPEHVRIILSAAINNSQIAEAGGTPAQITDLFERTIDLLPETKTQWQVHLTGVHGINDDDESDYAPLRKKMIAAGMWPMTFGK